MGYSPFLRQVGFWGSFYLLHNYARRDPRTQQHVNPSYLILKEKVFKELWANGFTDKLQDGFSLFSHELWNEIKSLKEWSICRNLTQNHHNPHHAIFVLCIIIQCCSRSAVLIGGLGEVGLSLFSWDDEGILEVFHTKFRPKLKQALRSFTILIGFHLDEG